MTSYSPPVQFPSKAIMINSADRTSGTSTKWSYDFGSELEDPTFDSCFIVFKDLFLVGTGKFLIANVLEEVQVRSSIAMGSGDIIQTDGKRDLLGYAFYINPTSYTPGEPAYPIQPVISAKQLMFSTPIPRGVQTFEIVQSSLGLVADLGTKNTMVHLQIYYYNKREAQEAYKFVSKMTFG